MCLPQNFRFQLAKKGILIPIDKINCREHDNGCPLHSCIDAHLFTPPERNRFYITIFNATNQDLLLFELCIHVYMFKKYSQKS